LEGLRGQFPHVSGMQIEYFGNDSNNIPQLKVFIDGKKLQADKVYKLATTDYLANGGDGYSIFLNGRATGDTSIQETLLISDLILRDIQTTGQLAAKVDKRYLDLSSQSADTEQMPTTRIDDE
jgi:2',3'-cyclic-nucleotide 2'-phosphodiesterase (5'-nucleotidase family)